MSIENHASKPQQIKMAKHLKSILGNALITKKLSEGETQNPSPAQLKNKFILKAKIIEELIEIPPGASEGERKDLEGS